LSKAPPPYAVRMGYPKSQKTEGGKGKDTKQERKATQKNRERKGKGRENRCAVRKKGKRRKKK